MPFCLAQFGCSNEQIAVVFQLHAFKCNHQSVIIPPNFNPVIRVYLKACLSLSLFPRTECWMFLRRFHAVEQDDNRALPCEFMLS